MGALSYVSILAVIMLVIKKDDAFVQFHAKQGVVIFVFSLLSMVPVIGWALAPIIGLVAIIASILGFIKAYQGEKYEMPLVSELAKKINI